MEKVSFGRFLTALAYLLGYFDKPCLKEKGEKEDWDNGDDDAGDGKAPLKLHETDDFLISLFLGKNQCNIFVRMRLLCSNPGSGTY